MIKTLRITLTERACGDFELDIMEGFTSDNMRTIIRKPKLNDIKNSLNNELASYFKQYQ